MADTPGAGPPAAPQRRWEAPCPNCGAPVPFVSAASTTAVCGYCRSTVVRDGDTLRKIGRSAELFDDHTPLQLGVTGEQNARAFTIVGRLQFGYGARDIPDGTWNEWHLLFDDGRSGWLSEDNDQYVIVFDVRLDAPPPAATTLKPGQTVTVAGLAWRVASVVEARPLAAEGELPALPAPTSRSIVADLRNEQAQVATLDYADPAKPGFSIGRAVKLADLKLAGLREGPDAGRKTIAARSFACPECGATVEATRAETRSLTCGSCHSLIDVSQGIGAELRATRQGLRFEPVIPLGTTGRLGIAGGEPEDWQVLGFSVKQANAGNAEEAFSWQDYLLYNAQHGFSFLVDTDEGWFGYRTLTGVPKVIGAGAAVEWEGGRYRLMARYPATVQYVAGEFYWQVDRAQVTQTADYNGMGAIANRRLSSERTSTEIVWSQGERIPAAVIRQAFRLTDVPDRTPQLADIGPVSGGQTVSWVIWLIVIIIVLLVLAECGDSGRGYYGTGGGSYGGYSSGGGHK